MTNETRTPSPHICPSCKASFADEGEFSAHMGGQCTPSPDDYDGIVEVDQADFAPVEWFRRDPVTGNLVSAKPPQHLTHEQIVAMLEERAAQSATIAGLREEVEGAVEAAVVIFERDEATIARLQEERDALLEKPIDLAKMDSIDDELTDQMISYFWWERSNELTATIARLNAEVERMRGHIAEQIEHVETRIDDGDKTNPRIWRIALEDVASENRAALAPKEGASDEA